MLTDYTMNFNHSWNGNRGRNRGNRGPTRNWRGGHYRGGSHFHRGAPPLLNSDNYYSPNRFRGHENFSNYYSHSPVNQNEQWTPRGRYPLLVNPRQPIPHNSHFPHQNPPRSLSPLPGSEEYMERNISEKSALLKRALELEGSGLATDSAKLVHSVNSDFQTDSTNNNFFEDPYSEDKTANEVTQSPRRSKKQRPISQSVEEIHQKIINHISSLSYNKKMNLVNLSGPSGYDIAIKEITRQKRMELSKVLRDMCHNKFRENEDSSQVINAIIPDFDIKIEELPREVVEQLSSTLDEDVTERVSMCIDPELMFQQAAEMLNTTLDIDKSSDEENKTQLEGDFNFETFAGENIGDEAIVDTIENKDPTHNATLDESISTPTVPNIESCPPPTFTFDIPASLDFDNAADSESIKTPKIESCPPPTFTFDIPESLEFDNDTMNESIETPKIESCPLPTFTFDIPEPLEFDIPSPVTVPPPSSQETNDVETSAANFVKPESELYSPGHESSNCSSPEPPALNYDVVNMPEPADIPIPAEVHTCAPPPNTDVASEEEAPAESDVLDLNNRDKISFNLNKRTLLKSDELPEEKSVKDDEEKSQASAAESQTEEKVEAPPKVVESEIAKEDKVEKVRERKSRSKNKEAKVKETKEEKKEQSPPKKVHKDRKSKSKVKEDDDEEKRKQEKKTKSKHETEESHKATEKEDRSERKRDKYNVSETSRTSYDDDGDRRKDKKSKSKYDDEYYSSKYERSKFDAYQGQGYDDGYRKRYRDSPAIEDDKHRRSEHVERYREVDPDIYHYSKYPVEIEDGRNSKRYYHEKSVYRQEYEYPYNKYEYPSTEYYQRPEVYPSEEYDQKVHYSKSHKNKYKRHSKKHKRHRDRSSDSNVSSSGSEKNSSTSSFKTNKQTSKQSELYDSSEEGASNRPPKTSLMERLQVLCDTKLGGIKLEPVSPNPNDDARKCSNVHSEGDKSGSKNNNESRKQPTRTSGDKPPSDKGDGTTKQKGTSSSRTREDTSSGTANTKNRSESEDDLRNSSEVESSESKNYKHRPWKSPGEKKFMMEHLHQNNPNEDGVEVDAEHDALADEELVLNSLSTEKPTSEKNAQRLELPVSSTAVPVERETVIEKIVVAAYTQTIVARTEHTHSQTVLDTMDKFTQATYEEEKKKVSTFSTQTVVSSVAASTQTAIPKTVEKGKLVQTDHVIIVDVAENVEVDESIPKTLRCKQFIDRMYEIDKEIDRLVKLRQSFYNLFLNVSDPDHETRDLKGVTDSLKAHPKLLDSKPSSSTPTPSIPERSTSKKRTTHGSSDRKNTPELSSRSHHKHTSADTKTGTPEPLKQKTAQSHRERSRKSDSKAVHGYDKQKISRSTEMAKMEKKEAVERIEKKELPSGKVQHHGRGRFKKIAPHGSNEEKVKSTREELSDEKKQKVTNLKEKIDTGRKRKLKNEETPEVKRLKRSEAIEETVGDKEKRAKKVEPAEVTPAEKEKSDEISSKEQKRPKKSDAVEANPVEDAPKEAKHSKKSDTVEAPIEEAFTKEKRSKKSDPVETNSVEEKRSKKSDTAETSLIEDTSVKEAKRLKTKSTEEMKSLKKVDASETEKLEDNESKRSKKSDALETNPIVTESEDKVQRSKKSDGVVDEEKADDAPNKEVKRSKKYNVIEDDPIEEQSAKNSEVVESLDVEKERDEIHNKESEAVNEIEAPSEVEQQTPNENDTKPDDSEDTKTSEMDVSDTLVEEEKKDAVIDNEVVEKSEVEDTLNGSFIEDMPEGMDEALPDRPITPGATLTSSDLSTPPKKKKRRLSGMMAEYRKKKKKSKKSKKKDAKHMNFRSESPEPSARSIDTICLPAPSSVKIIRFSIEQLESMRDSIRSKQVHEQPLSDNSPVSNEDPADSPEHDEAKELSEEVAEPTEEIACEAEPVADDTNTSTSYSIEFKNFTGAILVIKVIENTVLAASDKGQLLCFDMLNGDLLQTVEIASVAVTSIVLGCRNDMTTVYLGSLDTHLTIFNFQTKQIVKRENVSEPVQCMEYSWNFIFIGSDRGTLIRFDLDTETVVDQTKISNFNILMMKASTEGPRKILVVATRNSPVSIRDALSGLLLRTMETSFSPTVYTLLIDKNLIYCGTSQHDILVYTFEDGQLARQHEATKSKGVVCMQILGNLLFAGCYNGNIYVYNIKTNAYLGIMNGPGGLMLSMEIVDDKIIVGTKSSNFKAWKIPQQYYDEK